MAMCNENKIHKRYGPAKLVQVLMETDNDGNTLAAYNYGNGLISMNRAGTLSYYNYDGLGSTRQLTNDSGAVVASYTYDAFGNALSQTSGMASVKPVQEKGPINKAGITLFVFLGLGLGAVTIRDKRCGLIIFLIILLITGQIPTATAIEVDVTNNPYGFTGEQQFGEANNLIFLRARYYNPSIGRFISRDPILAPMRVGDNFLWSLPNLISNPQVMNSYVYCSNNPVNNIDPEGTGYPIIIIFIIIGTILTFDCLLKISKFMKKWNKLKKDMDPCDTRDTWEKATKTKEWRNVIRSCGMPWYVG